MDPKIKATLLGGALLIVSFLWSERTVIQILKRMSDNHALECDFKVIGTSKVYSTHLQNALSAILYGRPSVSKMFNNGLPQIVLKFNPIRPGGPFYNISRTLCSITLKFSYFS